MEGHSSTREGLKFVSTPITSPGLIEEFTWKCRDGMTYSLVQDDPCPSAATGTHLAGAWLASPTLVRGPGPAEAS
jgi:hypothetical protein